MSAHRHEPHCLEPGGLDAQPQRDEKLRSVMRRSRAFLLDAAVQELANGNRAEPAASTPSIKVALLLRLLHPDYVINLPLKGTKQHARIEAAFKKLSALRDI